MSQPELSRIVDRNRIGPQETLIEASEAERAALARRFDIVRIDRLEARLRLACEGDVVALEGRLIAQIMQSCAISGEDLPATIDEPLALRFVPETSVVEEEIELEEGELDEMPYTGHLIDVGEAVAQTLALAIDPYACGPEAERARREAGLSDGSASGPFAALAALKRGE